MNRKQYSVHFSTRKIKSNISRKYDKSVLNSECGKVFINREDWQEEYIIGNVSLPIGLFPVVYP